MRVIFLTHQLEQIDRPAVYKLFHELMFSVEALYDRLKASSFHNVRSRFNGCRVAYDSGGFAFLLGKIKSIPDPRRTCQIYRLLGYTESDFLIQLDLPPQYHMSREERLALIYKSAEFYHIMAGELKHPKLLGVVHGWTEDELKLSLRLLEDPDKLALGCNLSTMKVYAHDYIQKGVALGSYNVKTVLAEAVATPTCFAESKGFCPAGAPSLKVALGSYANTKNSIAWSKRIATHSGTAEKVLQRVPRDVVYDRLCTAMNLLREKEELFVLGGSGPNTAHLLFLLGAKYIDGAAWRLAAKLWRIYVPELGEFSVGVKRIAKRLNDQAIAVMREYYRDSPFTMSFNEFLEKICSPSHSFEYRALWNAYVLKVEEQIANDYCNDPDRYYQYLKRRWSTSPYWLQVLEFCWRRVKQPYVQTKLTVFLKGGGLFEKERGGVRGGG